MLEQVDELRRSARAAHRSGRPARASQLGRRGLQLLDKTASADRSSVAGAMRARLLITLAFAEFEVHGFVRGKERLAAALVAATECDSQDVLALVHDLRGLILMRSGDLRSALPEFDAAVRLLELLEPEDQAAVLLNRGTSHLLGGNLSVARTDLARCADIARDQGLLRLEFKARHNLGYAEYLAGNLPRALEIMAQADAIDVEVSRSVALLDRARVLIEAGLLTEADESLAAAARLLAGERANQDRAEAQLARAHLALMQGKAETARVLADLARRHFRSRASGAWQARADLLRWQADLAARGGASRIARQAIAFVSAPDATGTGAMRRDGVLIAAEVLLARGDVRGAMGLLEEVRRRSRTDPLSARMHHHLVRAAISRAAGNPSAARRELRSGLSTLAQQQARHHSLDLRTALTVHGGRLAALDLRMALESGSARSVFDSLERWRAMSQRRTSVTPPSDVGLGQLLSQLRIVTEEMRGSPPGAGTDRLRRRQRALETSIRENEWQRQAEGRVERPARLTELRPALRARSITVISYFVLDGWLGAVVEDGRHAIIRQQLAQWSVVASLVARIRADLDALSRALLPLPLRTAVSSSARHDLSQLDQLVLPPDVGEGRSLVVIPSRTLSTLPWGLLPSRRSLPTTVAVSATAWLLGFSAERPRAATGVLAVAGPAVLKGDDEARAVAGLWPGAIALRGSEARASALAEGLATHALVHIAAHGTHNTENALFSSLRLSDGPLFAYDIPQDRPIAGHIVLSACDLGLTTPRPGDEVLGLTAALLQLGGRCVVGAVARVGDDTAYRTMVRYHERLVRGEDSATALALADEGDLEHPAPFVCFGSAWTSA